ncbi:mavicyanin-like [Prosopis cineraria]|uniref:mavicyanin-like n=1 Tax=Prosopis cineraria TaxID=364024 RepID=UPI00240F29E5|nr:mavicyanin-like [Prosopis cineraria]
MSVASAFATTNMFFIVYFLTLLLQTKVSCLQYKVGDLDAWGIPASSNPDVYTKWSKHHNLKIGDSILFLYPPSQDSVIQVTAESYKSCDLKDPILHMNDGNSLFNITSNGEFYFTSGVAGHCQKKQKLRIVVGDGNGVTPSDAPTAALPENAADAPSYPTVFGSIPVTASSSAPSSLSSSALSLFIYALLGFAVSSLL